MVQGERDILLRVVWDASHPSLYLVDGLYQEVRVITTQIVEDNRYGCGLRAQGQFQAVKCVMSVISVFSGDSGYGQSHPQLVFHAHDRCCAVMSLPVLSCHLQGFGVSQHRFFFELLLQERF